MDWPVEGHDSAVQSLRRAIATGHLAHAYLLIGAPQVGKTTLARAAAQALLCTADERPCGACRACQKVSQGTHPDLFVVDPQTTSLLIDQMRELQRQAALLPIEGRYKVFIVRRIETASPEAANSMLKTLEEPPAHVILFLTLTEGEETLPTVASRCQRLALRRTPSPLVARVLRDRWGVDSERAELLARLCQGRLGWAVQMHGDQDAWRQRSQLLDQMLELSDQSRVERMRYAERLSTETPDAIREVLRLWESWWRDLLLMQYGCPDLVANIDLRSALGDVSRHYAASQSRAFLESLSSAGHHIDANVNARLALELLMLRMPYTKPSPARGS